MKPLHSAKKEAPGSAGRQVRNSLSGADRQDTQAMDVVQASSASVLPIAISKPGWRVRALKHVANVQFSNVDKHTVEDEVPVQLCNYTDVYKNDLIVPDMDFMQASATPAEIKKFRLRENDVIITKDSETWEDIAIPAHVTATMNGVLCGYHLAQLRPRSAVLRGKFLFYCLKARPVAYHFNISAFGITRFGLSNADIGRAPIPVPPLNTQDTIVAYLDRETRRIDTIIEKNRRLLELIDEKRIAVIRNAVTKGLNPFAKRRPSSLHWLREVPVHWETRRVKFCAGILRGKFSYRPRNAPHLYNGEFPFLQTGDIARSTGRITEYSQTLSEEGTKVSKSFPANTLVMAIAANVGDVAITNFEAYFPDSVVGFKPKADVDLQFLFFLLSAMRPQLLETAVISTQLNLNIERIGSLGCPLPPLREQREIVVHLNQTLELMAQVAAKVTRAIDLLRERRLALISAAVTGQL